MDLDTYPLLKASQMQKPRAWCATTSSSIFDNMPTFPDGEDFYPCITQDYILPTIDYAPRSNETGTGNEQHRIVLGTKSIIPRWAASISKPTQLLFFVIRNGFQNDADFEYTAKSFEEAADEWNALGLGVHISRTMDEGLATFPITYYKPAIDENILAQAFFPNKVKPVIVYDRTLVVPKWRAILKNSFLHEIGHILGLRHEFAIVPDTHGNGPERDPAFQFGSKNPNSVMSYEDKNEIQPSDVRDIKKFYALKNGHHIDKAPIKDYKPKPYKKAT